MRFIKKLKKYPTIDKIFDLLQSREEAVFLDSSLHGNLGQYSIIACRPYLKLVQHGEEFKVNDILVDGEILEYMRKYLHNNREDNETNLPIISGAIGYFSYDFGIKKAGISSQHKVKLDIPDCVFCFYDIFVIEDHQENVLYLVANGNSEEAFECIEKLQKLLEEHNFVENTKNAYQFSKYVKIESDFTKKDYMQAVNNMINYVVDGDIYVVNMTQQLRVESACEPYSMFCRLRKHNPSPFGAYLDYGNFQIVCASPERFLKVQNGKVITRPIKGTRKRGKTIVEDELLKKELVGSEKDRSELLMIVDLERNDFNRVCMPKTVKVTELFEIETYSTLFHLVSNVEGQLKSNKTIIDLLEVAFPGGSITGAPKLRAMELIDQQERNCRNLYTGSIGYISLNGDCDFNIVIRTAIHKDGVYNIGVGGGITYESNSSFEFEEIWHKAKALLKALEVDFVKGKDYEYTIR